MNINVSNLAIDDLIDIWLYGETEWGDLIADSYLDSLNLLIQSLTNFPEELPFAMSLNRQ